MNFDEINSPEAQKFIRENTDVSVETLLLSARKYPGLNVPLLVAQMEGKNKAKEKLPTWFASTRVIYPVKLSMEQCSSEVTASYKASLVSGNLMVDLTGGYGVDSKAFSEKMNRVIYVEQNSELTDIVRHNFSVFGLSTIELLNQGAEDFLHSFTDHANCIFIDPARRKGGSKVFRFADCEPNVIELLEKLMSVSDMVMIKTSPLLDIDQAVKELKYVQEVHIVAVENDCKELLFLLRKGSSEIFLTAINIKKDQTRETLRFTRREEVSAKVLLSKPLHYLYEPNAAILKSGAFKILAERMGVAKLNTNSHLYTSEKPIDNFPGRSFSIVKHLKYSKAEILAEIPGGKANVTVRNFPDSVDIIRKKTGLKDGGDQYLFATKDLDNKPVILLTEKIK